MKMKKKWALLVSVLTLVTTLGLTGCGSSTTSQEDNAKTLTVYTPESEELVNLIIPQFEKETGIKVQVITAGTGELVKRIDSEKANPNADVLMGGNAMMLDHYKDDFVKYVSPENKDMVKEFRNTTGYFTPFKADGSVIMVNTKLIGNIKIKGYADLLNPALKGKIASADPARSSSAFEQLVNILADMSPDHKRESPQAWDYVRKLVTNLNGKLLNSSSAVHKGVADGEYAVGLTYEEPAATYVKDGAPVKVVYMDEGVIFDGATIQIVKNAKHLENAKKFVDFVLSKKIQDEMGTKLCVRALRQGAAVGSHMKPLKDIKIIAPDDAWISAHKKQIIEQFTSIVTSTQK